MDIMRRIARAQVDSYGGLLGTDQAWIDAFRSGSTVSGKSVSVQNSFQVAAVWAAIRVLSDTVGTLPWITYERSGPGGIDRTRATTSRTYKLLHDEPNPEMSPTTLKRLLAVHLNSWGNAYLGKTFRGNAVTELWPILPQSVTVRRQDGVKTFTLRDANGREDPHVYTAREIVHMHGMSLDGLVGMSPIQYARESIGAAIAMDEYTNTFLRRGAIPRIALMSKKQLSPIAKRRLGQSWDRRYGGSRNANGVAVLEEGTDVKVLSLPQKDLEFVEQRKHSIQEMARWFRVPVALLEGDKGGSLTYSTVESENLSFSQHSVRPWTVAMEEEVNRDRDLFPNGREYSEFLLEELLRSDTKTRYESWAIALNPTTGWMGREEVRQRENLPADPRFQGVAPAPAPPPAAPAPVGR